MPSLEIVTGAAARGGGGAAAGGGVDPPPPVLSETDRTGLANGELRASQSSPVEEEEVSEVKIGREKLAMLRLTFQELATPSCCEMHETFIQQYCRKKSPSLIDILDKWFTR